jgi:hypothetical protein
MFFGFAARKARSKTEKNGVRLSFDHLLSGLKP